MALYRVLMIMLLGSVAIVTGLSVVPGTNPRLPPADFLKRLPPWKIPPGPITVMPPPHLDLPTFRPPRYCTCVVRCCKHALEKRRAIYSEAPALAVLVNSPLVRHRRCCGCQPCPLLRSQLQ